MLMRAAIFFLFLLLAPPAYAQVTFDTFASAQCGVGGALAACANAGTTPTLTYAITVAAGTDRQMAVMVFTGCSGTEDAPGPGGVTVTYNGVALTNTNTAQPGGSTGTRWGMVFRMAAGTQPATGTNNVVVTLPTTLGACSNVGVSSVAFSVAGVDQTTPFVTGTGVANSGTGTAPGVATVTNGVNDFVVHAACAGIDIISTTETIRVNIDDANSVCSSLGAATAAGGDVSWNYTITSSTWVMAGAAFKSNISSSRMLLLGVG